jgi:hypothetical protein|uniref:Uncharacterized protein n=1 Tax=Pseudomonas aeruginosa TaxID=287 RepID=A0A5P9WA61_PSEAI|nr:hypothetical protein [Pseudomonas aeruginosa]QFX78349.1 hypothetical protein pNK546KPC_0139 [Pseudomonas aeruginosa]QLG05593.1 hypothetical protein [Pseudomonas aeruginosa]UGK55553.1 Hypothetical protein [Pseudomonas aeruginosa]
MAGRYTFLEHVYLAGAKDMPGISRLWTDQTIVQSVPTMSVLI